jgi:hypothetical protein
MLYSFAKKEAKWCEWKKVERTDTTHLHCGSMTPVDRRAIGLVGSQRWEAMGCGA